MKVEIRFKNQLTEAFILLITGKPACTFVYNSQDQVTSYTHLAKKEVKTFDNIYDFVAVVDVPGVCD